jgi:hypothetical protein
MSYDLENYYTTHYTVMIELWNIGVEETKNKELWNIIMSYDSENVFSFFFFKHYTMMNPHNDAAAPFILQNKWKKNLLRWK